MCVCVCLYIEPVSWSKDYVRSWIKIGSVVCLYTPVSPSVFDMEGVHATGGILFWDCTFGGVYVPCIYSHARWSYRRRFRSLLLCPLSVERYYFPLFWWWFVQHYYVLELCPRWTKSEGSRNILHLSLKHLTYSRPVCFHLQNSAARCMYMRTFACGYMYL